MNVSSLYNSNSPLLNTVGGAGKSTGPGPSLSASPDDVKSTADQLKDYMELSPGEKLRASVLKEMGLKESDLDKMSGDAKSKIEDKIAQIVKQKVEQGALKGQGSLVDVQA